jgi:hypothetical protein
VNRTTLARRYAPLLAVLAVQLLVIAVVPSKAPTQVSAVADTVPDVSSTETTTPLTGAAGDTSTTLAAAGAVGSIGTRTTVRGGGTATAIVNGRVVAAGDTSHCVNGRQFDPSLWDWAPPCRGRFVGDNGGKTTEHGVSRDTIKVEVFRGNYGQAVQKILEQQRTWPSDADFVAFMQAAQDFINKNYDLAGRRIAFKYHQFQNGTGGQGPPDDKNLRNEVRLVQAKDDPFAALWNNAVSSATYDELSQLGVVNLGGYGFRDSFNVQHRPYHWDVEMGGTQLVTHVANWWCQRMNGGRAAFAGAPSQLGSHDLRGDTRVLGVVSTDDPENKEAITLLNQKLQATCGAHIEHRYFYSQDITTAAAQVQATISLLRSNPAATSVMCFCDQVAPAFLYNGQEQQDYRPENIIVATGFMDTDEVGQTYDHTLPLANPSAGADRQFENAFGLAQVHKRQNTTSGDAAWRVWRATGHAGALPFSASRDWQYYAMIGELLLAAGPNLTPANLEAGAFRVPPIAPGGNGNEYTNQRSLGSGDYTWNDNLREVFWSNSKKSEENDRPGAYVSLNAGRWFADQFPSGLISLPPKPR